jgi:hypothetical protein
MAINLHLYRAGMTVCASSVQLAQVLVLLSWSPMFLRASLAKQNVVPRASSKVKGYEGYLAREDFATEQSTEIGLPKFSYSLAGVSLFSRGEQQDYAPTQRGAPPSMRPIFIQPKLQIGAVNDPLELEADHVAEQVMRMPEPEMASAPLDHKSGPGPMQKVAGEALPLQRKCDCGGSCDDCKKKQPDEPAKVRMKAAGSTGAGGMEAPPIVHEVLRSPGQQLDAGTRAFMEPRFGHDFSKVRVHTDAKAAESVRAVGARAYTVGSNVVFGAGEYGPGTQAGQTLLGHELAHVVQQSSSPRRDTLSQRIPGGRVPLMIQRSPTVVPYEKSSADLEATYRRNGLIDAANAVARCRQGDCSKVLTEAEAYEAYKTGRLKAGLGDPGKDESTHYAPPAIAGVAAPLVSPGASAGAKSALERAAARWGTAEVIEGGGATAAPAAAAGTATVAVPVAMGIYVVLAILDLASYSSFQVALQKQGYTILPNPLQVCISGCHHPAAPTFKPMGPFVNPFPPFSPDSEAIRKWIEQSPNSGSQQQPQPGPRPAPQPKTKDKQKGCPYALPCEDQISRDEQVQEFLLKQGYSYESLGECRLMGAVAEIDVCEHESGQSWHCKVAPYMDPISKEQHPGGEVSIFECPCCDTNDDVGFEWRGAHWSGGK